MVIGGICLWSGSIATIPAGYALCNGSNGTPDLRDKFIIGAKQDDVGVPKTNVTGSLTQSGGSANHDHSLESGADLDAGTEDYSTTTSAASSLPPYYALAYIQRIS
jgi:hypothetical protein